MQRGIQRVESMDIKSMFRALDSSAGGLTGDEARRRLSTYGYNEVEEKKAHALVRFLKRFWGPTAWMLETVAAISVFLIQLINLYLALGLLVLNAIIGFWQESKSEKAVELLKKKLNVKTKVIRDGKWILKPARELVPGDIIFLRIGDVIPADVKLIDGQILVDQSALTGESLPVDKGPVNVSYAGSMVRRSEAKAVVVATGSRTFYGKTVTLVEIAKAKSHVEELIADVVRYLLLIVAVIAVTVFIYSVSIRTSLPGILSFILMLLVSSVPIALPAMFTVTMAIGAIRLFKSGVLITRITAVEDAATMTTVCTDKTGTITENKLSAVEPVVTERFSREDVLLLAMLASEATSRDPIDVAVVRYAKVMGVQRRGYAVLKFTAFDPSTRRTEALVQKPDGSTLRVMKGAPQVLIELSSSDAPSKRAYWQKVEELSAKGYRVIGVALEEKGNLKLAGFIPLQDRPRKDSARLVGELRSLGINVKMITGDNSVIASAVAREVGIDAGVCRTGKVGAEISREADKCDVFAEAYPEDKLTIVRGLQRKGQVVGMTGDGVNDAPALKQAEVGTAVKNATDAAKAAASVVLTEEGLSGIVELVKAGREAFQRMYTWIINKIVKTFQLAIFLSVAFFVLGIFVTTTSHLIILLFLTDFVTISLSTDNVITSQTPEKWEIGRMTKAAMLISTVVLLEMFVGLFIALHIFSLDLDQLYTFVFYMLMATGVTNVLVVRERKPLWSSRPSRTLSIALLTDITLATTLCMIGVEGILAPIPIAAILTMLLLAAVMMLPKDYVKMVILAHEYKEKTEEKSPSSSVKRGYSKKRQ